MNKKKKIEEIIDNIEAKNNGADDIDVEYDEKEILEKEEPESEQVDLEENSYEDEQPERKDKIMDVLIAVFATFILMFTTFGILKVNSALKSATILNNNAEVTTQTKEEESSENASTEEYTKEEVTTYRNEFVTTQPSTEETTTKEEKTTKKKKEDKEENDKETETEPQTDEKDSSKKAEELLNSLSLSSMSTGYSTLDSKVSGVVSGITGNQYEKLLGIYDYVVKNVSISGGSTNPEIVYNMLGDLEYENSFDAYRVFEATQALNTFSANNDGFASAFLVLARAAGYNAYFVKGSSYKLQSSNHAWVIINIKNIDYLFDPYTDAKCGNTKENYGYFCKTMSSLNGTYVYANKAEDKNSFCSFRTVPAMTLNVDYGELTAACKWVPSQEKKPCSTKFENLISVESQLEISANVPGNSIAQWNIEITNKKTNERIQPEYTSSENEMKCVWQGIEAGNYTMTISATDINGRHCEIISDVQVAGNKALSGLSVTQKKYEAKEEAYVIEAAAQDGIGEVQYDFKVYVVDENGENVPVGKEWIEWNSLSSIIIRIPEGTKIGSTIKIKVTAVDESSNKAEQEITINTKGK